MITKEAVKNEITKFILAYERHGQSRRWRLPIVGFADANRPEFTALKELVHPEHDLPHHVLPGARIVIAYFVPFTEDISNGNTGKGLSSPEWASVYEETNAMFVKLNDHLILFLKDYGYLAAVSKEAAVFDRQEILSRWSQRHIAKIAGLGTFGLNNMLITDAGCCGRISTLVTDLDVESDQPLAVENCLYKNNGTCGICMKHCPVHALSAECFNRKLCYDQCMENAKVYQQFGNSYASTSSSKVENSGSEVCGKCLTKLPCTLQKP